ncbi:nitroreductase [Cocleimonas sp. KMM 6892]|uniref:nitroreductase n=1 Tax=unclassified Cocleimonas TaxID=2639732 RepID=UPI002DB78093|nr:MULTISPECIES: nitroreductase [unclassified Cocleimonas]MEB8432597.1 nitroreductase [Cocleimonas sp. KMM 6892]MEC4715456.1 nitroreductase [Cocleimonas sp. KMM 6895]MEC4744926.1 nitroreductase [Cocleimonas sp. KMM 6896]
MNILDTLKARKSVRGYIDKPVEREQIISLLNAARLAPSGSNIQPWQVVVLTDEKKNHLQQKLETAFRKNTPIQQDYIYYPVIWKEPYKGRRKDCGLQLYQSLNITQDDKQRRMMQWIANYHSFDAPVLLLFFMDKEMETGSYIDYGMFMQSLMLAAVEQGLATCAQAALCDYSDIIREFLGFDNDKVLICGMALGYENQDAAVNQYRTPREDVEVFTLFVE